MLIALVDFVETSMVLQSTMSSFTMVYMLFTSCIYSVHQSSAEPFCVCDKISFHYMQVAKSAQLSLATNRKSIIQTKIVRTRMKRIMTHWTLRMWTIHAPHL